jgi:hypothetical protein
MNRVLSEAFSGMDDALLKVVEANKIAIKKLTDGGVSFQESSLKKALVELEKIEDQFLGAIQKASTASNEAVKQNWKAILDKVPHGSIGTGGMVGEMVASQSRQMQEVMRASRRQASKQLMRLRSTMAR